MEIKHLQSIAKRQQNQIAYMEGYIDIIYKAYVNTKNREFLAAFWDAKRELKKLVALQKAVKNDLAYAVRDARFERAVLEIMITDSSYHKGVLQ